MALPLLHVFSDLDHPRLRYVLDVLIRHHWNCDWKLHTSAQSLRSAGGPRLWYASQSPPSDLQVLSIPSRGVLEKNFSTLTSTSVGSWHNLPTIFPAPSQTGPVPFDLPAAIFFLLSRWEEYQPASTDRHGRMPARKSLLGQHDLLARPLVDEWANRLWMELKATFPRLPDRKYPYTFLPTYDIDQAWCYRHKGWMRNLGGGLRDLFRGNGRAVGERFRVLSGSSSDPFDQFQQLQQWHRELELPARFFWLMGGNSAYDKNIAPRIPAFRRRILETSEAFSAGLHPSYLSTQNPSGLSTEKEALESILNDAVIHSRQHYLRLHWPATYRQLIEAGIRFDYTLGFADEIGFRAGTARPFPWYDLPAEKATGLILVPFQLMDVTARNYLQLTPEETLERALQTSEQIRAVGGQFVTLWHNSSLSKYGGWEEWRSIYYQILRDCR